MHLSRVASHALYWSGASTTAVAVLQIIQLAALARLLSPTDFGLAAMMAVVIGLAGVYGDLGLSNAVLTHSPLSKRVLSSLYWVGLIAGLLLTALVVLIAPLAAHLFAEPKLTELVRLAALGFLLVPLGVQFQLLLQRNLEFRPIVLVEVPSTALGVAVAVACAWRGLGVFSFVIGSLVGTGAKALAYLAIGVRRWPLSMECSLSEVRQMLGFGVYQLGERTVFYLSQNLDKAVIGSLLGPVALGYYSTAFQLTQKPLQLLQPMATRVTTPLYVHIRDDKSRLASAYVLVVELSAAVLFPVFSLLIVLAEPIVILFLGERWQGITPVLRWLSLLGCFLAVGFPIGSLLIARKRADWSFWFNIWRLLPFTVAILVGSNFGLTGVAISLVIAQAVGAFPAGFVLPARLIGMPASRFLLALVGPAALALVAAATVYAWLATVSSGHLSRIVWGAGLFAAIYGGGFFVFRRSFLLRIGQHLGVIRPGGGNPGDKFE